MIADLALLVDDMVRDGASRIGADQRDRAIGLAVVQYGRDRPRLLVADVTLAADQLITLPAGTTAVAAIEFPIGARPLSMLGAGQWSRYDAPDLVPRVLVEAPIATGSTLRVTYCAVHQLTDSLDTLPPEDREAVASYAAAVLFDQMSADTSGDGNPTIAADAVNHQAKPENFARRAERLRGRYHDLLGIDPKRAKPASITVEQPLAPSTGGSRLTHRRGRLWPIR